MVSNLEKKDIELEKLKNDLIKTNNTQSINTNQNDNVIAVAFTTIDKKFIYPLPCKLTDSFGKLEEKLYEKFPQYKEVNTYFTDSDRAIKGFKTIQENEIKCSDIIILNVVE